MTRTVPSLSLPTLLYAGNVPVESSYHGSALLFRLLEGYPSGKLLIVEGKHARSLPERRLRAVTYATLSVGYGRLLSTRFARVYSSWITCRQRRSARRLESVLGDFRPEAVLTVTHGFAWDAAARVAAARQLPLHLICHDDWPSSASVFPILKPRVDRRLGEVYRQAVSRLCVSPFMRDAYRDRYGATGEVLLPARAADCVVHSAPPERLREDHALTVAFAGTVSTPAYASSLRQTADALAPIGGRLLIFGPLTAAVAPRMGIDSPNVEFRGLLPSSALIAHLRDEADILFVPMSFEPWDRTNVEASFPSKLADYTAVGLPLLIFGPEYCSAVRWARENPGTAEVVTEPTVDALASLMQRLAVSPSARWRLGQQALDIGARSFSYSDARDRFYHALGRGSGGGLLQ